MKSMRVHVYRKAVLMLTLATIGLTVGGVLAQVPSSALHRGGVDSGAPASSPAWNAPTAIAGRPATTPGQPQPTAALRIIDPQDNAQRTRSNFRITIATSAAYANRLATVTVHQQVQSAVPSTGGYTNGNAGLTLPSSRDAKWDVQVSQLLQGWSPPVSKGWFDPNIWFEEISGYALVEVSFAIPERAQRLSAQTHVTFAKIDVARDERTAQPRALQSTAVPSHRPVSVAPRP